VKIQHAALVYHGVIVEDGFFIGPNAILTNDRFLGAITASSAVAREDDLLVSAIRLRAGVSIGAWAAVVAGHDVVRFALVGAGAGRHPRRSQLRTRRAEPRPPARLGLCRRTALGG
jgi:acetyltransferase-like isoleucine patch superfamily enzyme